jgi:hypothetical protein
MVRLLSPTKPGVFDNVPATADGGMSGKRSAPDGGAGTIGLCNCSAGTQEDPVVFHVKIMSAIVMALVLAIIVLAVISA